MPPPSPLNFPAPIHPSLIPGWRLGQREFDTVHDQIHPSPLLGGRLGGGWEVASDYQRPNVAARTLLGCVYTNRAQHPLPSPIHPSPLSGGRLGGGWEVASQRRPPSCTPIAFPVLLAPRHSCAPLRHSCAGRNPGDLQRLCAPRGRDDPAKPLPRSRAAEVVREAVERAGFLPAQE